MAIDDGDDLDTLSNNSSQSILEEPEAEEDEEFPELFNVPWTDSRPENAYRRNLFTGEMPGPNKPVLNALEILQLFVTDDVMSAVVETTNEHVASEAGRPAKRKRQRDNKNIEKEITSAELWIFISVLILSDIHDKPAVRDNWSTNALLNTPAFSQITSVCS